MDTTNIMNKAADTATQQDTAEPGTTGAFRSPFLNTLVRKLRDAQEAEQHHTEKRRQLQNNYKGELLLSAVSEENSRHASEIRNILEDIDRMTQSEQERLRAKKKEDLLNTGDESGILAKLDRTDGLLTEEELQMIADACPHSEIVQRKCLKTAETHGYHINTRPSIDRQIQTIADTAENIKSYIHSGNAGLEAEIYIKIGLPEADDTLAPAEKEEAAS